MNSNKVALRWIVWVLVIAGILAIIIYVRPIIDLMRSKAALGPSLAISPMSINAQTGDTITVDVVLDTTGVNVDGVDIMNLRFNPSIIQVQDDNTSMGGVQVLPGGMFPNTLANNADNTLGVVTFSQLTAGGTTYAGTGKLVTIHFKAIGAGTSPVTLDFTSGSTGDTNVAAGGVDVLANVVNGAVTVTTPPTPTPVPTPTPEPTPVPTPTPSPITNKFKIGDTVQTTTRVNVRKSPGGGTPTGKQNAAAAGIVTAGPTVVSGVAWWNIDFTTGADGWVVETYLKIK